MNRWKIVLGMTVLLCGYVSVCFGKPPLPWLTHIQQAPFSIKHQPFLAAAPNAVAKVVIVATSDLHGWVSTKHVFPERPAQGILHIAPLIEQLRETYPHLLLLDAGDTLQGSASAYFYSYEHKEKTTLPIVTLMNALRYDAVAIGNHDFEPPPRVLQSALEVSQFPWLASNLRTVKDTPALPPYRVVERNGVRVGILGMVTPGTPMWINAEHLQGLAFQDMAIAAQKWVPILREQEQVDVLIGLFHSGHNLRYDQSIALRQGVALPNAAGVIADHVEGFDVIISGHAHRAYPKTATNRLTRFRTPMVGPGSWGEGVSVVKLFLKEHQGRWKLHHQEYDFLKARSNPSKKLEERADALLRPVHDYLETPTSVWLVANPSQEGFYQCGAEVSHRVAQRISETSSFSLLPGRWRWAYISKNSLPQLVKRLHLFRWLPYDNFLIQALLYGRQMEILLTPYRRQAQGLRFHYSSLLSPGGFHVSFEDSHTKLILRNNRSSQNLNPLQQYSVWMTNYHWNGGGGLAANALLHPSQKQQQTSHTLRDLVFAFLQDASLPLPVACQSFLKRK